MASNGRRSKSILQPRSGAQIRSHAQKYFLKIQKEYPDQDSFEVFKSKTPEFLEDTIFMKRKGESDDESSFNSKSIEKPHISSSVKEEVCEKKEDLGFDFSKSVNEMLSRKRGDPPQVAKVLASQVPVHQNLHLNSDLLSIKAFFDHVKNSLTGAFVRNQGGTRYTSNEEEL